MTVERWESVKERLLRDTKVRAEYDALESWYQRQCERLARKEALDGDAESCYNNPMANVIQRETDVDKEGLRTRIEVDIADWVEELLDTDVDIQDDDAVVALSQEGYSTGAIARMTVAARENGRAPEDIIAPNKLLLYSGARLEVAEKHARRKRTVTTVEGKEVEVREFVGTHMGEEEHETPERSWVPSASAVGIELARRYLENQVPGHIYSRMAILASGGADIHEAADVLKDKIDEIVARLA